MTAALAREDHSSALRRLEAGTWGAFFVWTGVAILADLEWGAWLLGVGVIVLGAQLARRAAGLRHEGFWLLAGLLFVLLGAAELFGLAVRVAWMPLACIVAGVVLLLRAATGREGRRPLPPRRRAAGTGETDKPETASIRAPGND